MIFAHLLIGYVITTLITQKQKSPIAYYAGIIGSILPDIDLFYHSFLSNGKTLHHAYLTHIPILWFAITTVALFAQYFSNAKSWFVL